MWIGGKLVPGAAALQVVNPASGRPFAAAPNCTAEQLNQAVEAAQAAYPAWKARGHTRATGLAAASGRRPEVPFAGHKQSGFGVENGIEGLLEYMVPQAIYPEVRAR